MVPAEWGEEEEEVRGDGSGAMRAVWAMIAAAEAGAMSVMSAYARALGGALDENTSVEARGNSSTVLCCD
jgi:hypothetical protein